MNSPTIIDRDGNVAIVQFPDRKYPAIALQGDTFHDLVERVRRAIQGEEEVDLLSDLERMQAMYLKAVEHLRLQPPW
ncbi:MAG: hypothetical protein KF902_15165 [Phycisphaeraceae bacterium]|nr:hypothetical protein [Phycisphaeraceae bacterium]